MLPNPQNHSDHNHTCTENHLRICPFFWIEATQNKSQPWIRVAMCMKENEQGRITSEGLSYSHSLLIFPTSNPITSTLHLDSPIAHPLLITLSSAHSTDLLTAHVPYFKTFPNLHSIDLPIAYLHYLSPTYTHTPGTLIVHVPLAYHVHHTPFHFLLVLPSATNT